MGWSYNPLIIATSSLMQVRRLIGDVLSADQQLQDEEINWEISRFSTIYGAAAECCRTIASQFARQVDLVQGQLKTNYSRRSVRYEQLAKDLEQRGLRGVIPYAGGIGIADKNTNEGNSDRVPPDFNRGMFDNLYPEFPVGNQTPTPGAPDTSDESDGDFGP